MTIERFLHEVLCNSLIQAAREWDLNEAHAYYLAAVASYQLLERASDRESAINTARYLVQTKYLGDVTEAVKSNCLIRFDKRVHDLEQTANGFFISCISIARSWLCSSLLIFSNSICWFERSKS